MIEVRSRRRYQAMGIAFLVVAGLFLAGTIGMYNKAFTRFVAVTVRADTAGNQMMPGADVKVRGVVVGEVRAIDAGNGHADLRLALQPEKAGMIPANASARLLPKTLFGERYVALDVPKEAASATLSAGDVIPQDRSASAMEIEKVFGDLMPVLQAVQPQQVATTLNAVSQALEGRGEQLGDTLVQLDRYLQGFDPSLPKLESVISRVDDVAENYADAAPDLMQAVNDLTTTSRTVVEQRGQLQQMTGALTSASGEMDRFLSANGNNFIRLAGTSRSTLELLAKYSPQYPCMLQQFQAGSKNADLTFGTAARMGPGYFPVLLSGLIIAIGLVLAVKGVTVDGPPIEPVQLRPISFIVAAILIGWGIALIEYCFAIPANRIGYADGLTGGQLKIMQEVITLAIFAVFAAVVLKEPVGWRYAGAFACLAGAAAFMFAGRT